MHPITIDVDGLVESARRLVRIPSWNGNEEPAQDAVAGLMAESGLAVDRWAIDLDAVQAHPECSWEIARDHASGLVGSLEGTGRGPTLVLNGHVDVVPPGDEAGWTDPPFAGVVRDGMLRGRGALDMKGPLMAGLFALRAIRDAQLELAGTARLQSVIGEEDGGLGTLATVLRGSRADAAIVMEPTGLRVAAAGAGCLNFRVAVPGLAAHGAVRDEGVSALEKLFVVHRALLSLEARRHEETTRDPGFARHAQPFPISIGTFRGGDWASSVPDHATMEGRMGVRPGEGFTEARTVLETAVAEAAAHDPFLRAHPPRVTWWGGRFRPFSTEPGDRLVESVVGASRLVTGRDAPPTGVTFGSDAGTLSHVGGLPVVVYGAGDIRNAHRPDEAVAIEDLITMAEVIARTVIDYCGLA